MANKDNTVMLYRFSYYDELRGRWIRARYKCSLEDIRQRYPQHRIEGKPETRRGSGQFIPPGPKR